jgi:hypothetical protein
MGLYGSSCSRSPQAHELVRGLGRAEVIQPSHEISRVDRRRPPGGDLRRRISDIGRARQVVGQQRPGGGEVLGAVHVKALHPVALGQVRGLVPVVPGGVHDEPRPQARLEPHERVGHVAERNPHLEGRMRLEGVGPVVLEDRQQGA